MIVAGIKEYSINKIFDSTSSTITKKDRMLLENMFQTDSKDWVLERAGQRVQVIKKDEKEGGILEFGTEVINTADGSLAVLLGASPGASTAVSDYDRFS
jgi:malate dehydrogenase (quinone)